MLKELSSSRMPQSYVSGPEGMLPWVEVQVACLGPSAAPGRVAGIMSLSAEAGRFFPLRMRGVQPEHGSV